MPTLRNLNPGVHLRVTRAAAAGRAASDQRPASAREAPGLPRSSISSTSRPDPRARGLSAATSQTRPSAQFASAMPTATGTPFLSDQAVPTSRRASVATATGQGASTRSGLQGNRDGKPSLHGLLPGAKVQDAALRLVDIGRESWPDSSAVTRAAGVPSLGTSGSSMKPLSPPAILPFHQRVLEARSVLEPASTGQRRASASS